MEQQLKEIYDLNKKISDITMQMVVDAPRNLRVMTLHHASMMLDMLIVALQEGK